MSKINKFRPGVKVWAGKTTTCPTEHGDGCGQANKKIMNAALIFLIHSWFSKCIPSISSTLTGMPDMIASRKYALQRDHVDAILCPDLP